MSPGSLRRLLLEASNLFAPVVDEVIAQRVLAVIPHASLAERELVLRVHERRRCAAPNATDTARAKDAVANDLLVQSFQLRPAAMNVTNYVNSLARRQPPRGANELQIGRPSQPICINNFSILLSLPYWMRCYVNSMETGSSQRAGWDWLVPPCVK